MIIFKSNNSGVSETLVIGGSDSALASPSVGGYGPFPRYSISREEIFADDGTYLNSKYTININGTAVIKPSENSNPLIKGQRQSLVQGETIIKLQFNRNKWPMIGDGTLSIQAYDDNTNQIKFYDARLISVNIPETTDESAGIHFVEYAFVFEAYDLDGAELPQYLVSSVQESWELTENDGQYCFNNSDISSKDVYKTFTLTHTLSATGIRKYNGSTSIDSEAWYQASEWVKSRKIDTPNETEIEKHINDQIIGPKFTPFYMNSTNKKDDLKIDLIRGGIKYKAYNHVRNAGIDISGAGYNLTDTWLIALESSKAIHQISCELENSTDGQATILTASDNITGLNTKGIIENKNDAFNSAKLELDKILSENKLFTFAKKIYDEINTNLKPVGRVLRDQIQSKTISYNRVTGNINLSVSYNAEDMISDPNKVASETITLNYDNNSLNTKKIAIIPVIGRAAGPVIQSFNTEKERKISINIDLLMKPEHRSKDPPRTIADGIINRYKPANSYINSRSEQWNEKTGLYNVSMEWIYK